MADVDLVRNKVQDILARNFRVELTERGFTLRNESARMFIEVSQLGDREDGPVGIFLLCPLLREVPSSPELFRHIAVAAGDYLFGHLSVKIEGDGTSFIFFQHALLGDFLDEEELGSAVALVLSTANQIDDELQSMFGGLRFHED